MATDDETADLVLDAAEAAGEDFWQLPIPRGDARQARLQGGRPEVDGRRPLRRRAGGGGLPARVRRRRHALGPPGHRRARPSSTGKPVRLRLGRAARASASAPWSPGPLARGLTTARSRADPPDHAAPGRRPPDGRRARTARRVDRPAPPSPRCRAATTAAPAPAEPRRPVAIPRGTPPPARGADAAPRPGPVRVPATTSAHRSSERLADRMGADRATTLRRTRAQRRSGCRLLRVL